jgi:hypothetical protein
MDQPAILDLDLKPVRDRVADLDRRLDALRRHL